MTSVFSFTVQDKQGQSVDLAQYEGHVLLIVNTASRCGFTPQYEGLQHLFTEFEREGFVVMAFPCNQFGHQEPGSDAEITDFCQLNYRISFPVMAKIDVNGQGAAPLFQHVKQAAPGLLGSRMIKWNFTKFLVNRRGDVIKRYSPSVAPEAIADDIEALL